MCTCPMSPGGLWNEAESQQACRHAIPFRIPKGRKRASLASRRQGRSIFQNTAFLERAWGRLLKGEWSGGYRCCRPQEAVLWYSVGME